MLLHFSIPTESCYMCCCEITSSRIGLLGPQGIRICFCHQLLIISPLSLARASYRLWTDIEEKKRRKTSCDHHICHRSINKNKTKLSSQGKKIQFSTSDLCTTGSYKDRSIKTKRKWTLFGLVWFQLKILAATQCKNINITIWSRNSTQSTLFTISWSTWASGLTMLIIVTRFGNHFWLPTPLWSWGFGSWSWSWPHNRDIFRLLPPRFLRYVR